MLLMKIEKTKPLHKIFSDIPKHYDMINRIVTLGMDVRWRKVLAKACLEGNPSIVLDLCCGTGDLAISMACFSKMNTRIIGLDFSKEMLKIALDKANNKGLKSIDFVHGDASEMPFDNETFDSIGISFGFRNLTYANISSEKHLSEIIRVLAKGGRFAIAETSQPQSKFVRFFFHLYMRLFVLPVGVLISGNRPAYKYFAKSACEYYDRSQITELLLKAGFSTVKYRPMMFGATSLIVAVK